MSRISSYPLYSIPAFIFFYDVNKKFSGPKRQMEKLCFLSIRPNPYRVFGLKSRGNHKPVEGRCFEPDLVLVCQLFEPKKPVKF